MVLPSVASRAVWPYHQMNWAPTLSALAFLVSVVRAIWLPLPRSSTRSILPQTALSGVLAL